ncbi:fibronectin type III domain-containing protein [Parasediminibacterium sp. JCM 36343]|uniref:fibronectin type III domain-containing protein n=1 Tax=Parasediminibacterium sp. JCM 36343 TaxID=3374279 RepID=UPI00397D3C47
MLLGIFTTIIVNAQTNYYYQSGNLDAVGSWTLNSNGTGSNPTSFTAANQVFNITKTTIVNTYSSSSATWTVSGSGSYILVGSGATATILGIPAGNAITGAVSVQTLATLKVESNASTPFTAGTFYATISQGSSLVYDGSGTQYLPAGSYSGGLTINGTSNTVVLNGNIAIGAGSSGSPSSATLNMSSGTTLNLNSFNATIKRTSTIPNGATLNFGATGTIQPYSGYYVGFATGANVVTSNANGLDASMNYSNVSTTANSFSAGVNYTFGGATSAPFSTLVCGTATTSSSGTGSTSFTVSNASSIAAGQLIYVGAGQTSYGNVTSVSGTTVYANMATAVASGANVNFRNSSQSVSAGNVTINASVTTNANVGISGNLAIASGNNLNDNGNTLTVSGNISGSGTHSGTGKISMAGTSSTISIGTVGNLEVAVGTGNTVSLANSQTINGTLTLTSGFLLLGNNNLTLSCSALNSGVTNSISWSSSSSYIVANGSGSVKIQSVNSSSPAKNTSPTLFPIGISTSSYNPLVFTGTTNAPDITVGVAALFTNAPLLPNNVVNAQWSILSSAASGATIAYQYNTSNQGSSYLSTGAILGTYSSSYTESPLGTVSGSNPFAVSTPTSISLPTSTRLYGIGTPNSFFNIAPNAPTSVTDTAGNAQARVFFTAPSGNGGSAITGYTVTSNPGGLTATGASSPITVTGLTNGTAYTFTVTATNAAGTGAASAASAAVTPATVPSAPAITNAVSSTGQATISFTPPAANGSPITGYTITSSPSASLTQSSTTSSPITVTGLANGTAYTFTITATNGIGTGLGNTTSLLTPGAFNYSSGNVDGAGSWVSSDGSGGNPINFIADGQTFIIMGTASVNSWSSPSAVWTVSGINSAVTVGDSTNSVTLYIPSGNSIAGKVNVQAGSVLQVESNTNPPFIAGTFTSTSSVGASLVYDGSGTQYLPAGSYSGGLTINGTSNTVVLNGNIAIGAGSGGSPSSATLNMSSGTTLSLNAFNATIKRTSTIPSGATLNFGATGTIQPYSGYYVGFASGANVVSSNANGLDASMNYSNVSTTSNSFSAGVNYTFGGATAAPFSTLVCGTATTSSSGTGSTSFTVSNANSIASGQLIYVGAGQTSYGNVTSVSGTTVYANMATAVASGANVNFRNSSQSVSAGNVAINANVTANANASITGNLAIASGNNLNDNGNTLTVSGNISGSGTQSGTGKISMAGTSPTISIGTVGNLEVAAGTGNTVSLANSLTINGTLTLTSGFLLLGNNNLTLSGSALNSGDTNSISLNNGSSYIVANGSGSVKMQSVNSSSPAKNTSPTLFPIGMSTSSYNPLVFTGTTNAPDITVGVAALFTNAPLLPNNVVNAQWSILSSAASGATIAYQYNTSNQGSSYLSTGAILGTYSSSYTESPLGTVSGSNPFTVSTSSSISLPTSTRLYGIGTPNSFFNTVPNAPTAVSASPGNAQAVVSFTAPGSNGGSVITGYTVTSNPGGLTATGAFSPITVTGLINGTAYTFTVKATNAAGTGTASAASAPVTPITVANAPTAVSATPSNAQARVSFTAPSSNGGSTITNYTVTSSPGGLTATGASSPITVTGLTNGTGYTFTVTATNAAGTGAASAASAAVTPITVATAPTSVSATAGNAQAVVSFTAPASNGGSGITGYTVISSPGGLTAADASSPITVTGLANGTAYTFTVTATNAAGTGAASAASAAVTPITVPNAPTGVSATAGNAQVVVSFTAPGSNGGSAITGYTVTSSPSGIVGTGSSSPITVSGLANGTAYTFTVKATNAAGTGAASTASAAVTPITVATAPTGVSATAGNAQAVVSFTAPSSNGGSAITGYTVTSSPGGIIGTGSSSPVTVSGLANGTAYTFTVTATNGAGIGATSTASAAVTPITVPNAPTSVSAAANNCFAVVSFTAPSSNGGSAITGYTVTSSPSGIISTGSSSPVTVSGLANGTAYTFSVTATNAAGIGAASTASAAITPQGTVASAGFISDTALFSALNLNYPGMDSVRIAVQAGNYTLAKTQYRLFRINHAPKWLPLGSPSGNGTVDSSAYKISQNWIGPDQVGNCPPNYNFGVPVTNIGAHWYQNPYLPTDPGYSNLWTPSMERFTFWRSLSGGYWTTLNESYAKAWVNQMCNWVKTIPVDLTTSVENGRDSAINGAVIQSLQMGMRMEDTWTDAYFHFIQSPSFVDTAVATYAKGVLGHGWRMNWGASAFYNSNEAPSNHEIIEASGLAVVAIVFPEFNDATTWKQTAFNLLKRSMDSTVYDDGAENELSPGYHNWSMNYFTQVAQIAKLNNVSIPDSAYFYNKLKKMYWYNLYLMQPNGYLPPTNDNSDSVAAEAPPTTMWNDPEFQFLASGGTQGKAPDTLSYRFPWAGFNVMRSSWNSQANYMFFKNGPIGSWWHGHEDDLSLFLNCFGYPLLAEAEGWNYDNSLQLYYTKITPAHNTIAVDGKYQHRLDDSTVALKEFPQKISTAPSNQPWLTNGVADYTSGTYNDGYQAETFKGSVNPKNFTGSKDYSVSHTRHLVFLKPYYYVVTDFLEGTGSHKYENYFQLNADTAIIVNASNKAVASYSSHTTAHLLVSPIDTLGLSDTIVKGSSSPSALQGWIAQTEAVPMTKIPSLIYKKTQTASTSGASFATLLYPYNNTSTPPSVTTSLLTGIGTGIWGCKGTTPYENFIVVIRRYDSLNSTMTITTPFKFTANAHTAIGRQMTNARDTTVTFDSLNSFSGGIATFTCTKANYIVNQSAASQVNVYNDNNASMSIIITKPVSQSFTIPSHQWIKITSSGITDSIPNPTDSITNPVSTVMVMGDTMLIGNKYTDLIGHVSNVQLFDNLEAQGVDSTDPFAIAFSPTTTGLHTLNAVLTDSLGNTVTSPPVNVSVNNFEAEFYTKDSTGTIDVNLNYSNDTLVKMMAHGWLEYSVDVNHTGKYSLYANLLNNDSVNSFSISIDGLPAANSGTTLGNITIPVSANYQTIKNDSFDITAGRHTLRVTFNNNIAGVDYFRLNYYYPVAAFLQAAAFSDTGSFAIGINQNGYLYPIQLDEAYGGGVIFSNLDSNWIEYKVNIPTATTYSLQLRMANKYSSTGKRIEIYANGAFIQKNTFPTYTWNGTNQTLNDLDTTIAFTSAGPQTLRFKTYGTSTAFGSVNITPTGIKNAIKIPVRDTTIYAGTSLLIKDSATTTSGTITKVEFYNGDLLLATVTTGSGGIFSYNWTNIPYGTFRITTKAYTSNGYFYYSRPLNIFSLYTLYSIIPFFNPKDKKIQWGAFNWLASTVTNEDRRSPFKANAILEKKEAIEQKYAPFASGYNAKDLISTAWATYFKIAYSVAGTAAKWGEIAATEEE